MSLRCPEQRAKADSSASLRNDNNSLENDNNSLGNDNKISG